LHRISSGAIGNSSIRPALLPPGMPDDLLRACGQSWLRVPEHKQKKPISEMELPDIYYNKSEYVETASGNKVCRNTVLCGSQNIVINGKSIVRDGVIIRGDLANVRIGRQCIIDTKVVVRPSFKKFSQGVAFFPLHIGDNVFIGEGSVINAAMIGSYVYIGKNCVIGRRAVLKDCCMIADNTVIAADSVVPTFAIYKGSPGVHVDDQPDCTQDLMIEHTKSYYQHFLPNSLDPKDNPFAFIANYIRDAKAEAS